MPSAKNGIFSVVDVVGALTGSGNPRWYWSDLKRKLKSEGAVELYENIVQLKLKSPDGKKRLTDVADTEQLMAIRIRNELTDEWSKRGVQKGREYAILTDEISKAWSGMTTRQYKDVKGLKKESLRDNMSDLELVLNMLAEASTTGISQIEKPDGMAENLSVAQLGGRIAGNARKELEQEMGRPVISAENAKTMKLVTDIIEDAAKLPEKGEE